MNIREARGLLKMTQREAIKRAAKDDVILTQTTLSRMETGNLPIALNYSTWLAKRLIAKRKLYDRVRDMPSGILAACIKHREEI